MTDRKKAIRILEGNYKSFVLRHKGELITVNELLALLKAQETCEDAVNRKDVINVIKSPCDMCYINGNWQPCIGDYIEAINNLPAAAPKAQEPRVMTLEEVITSKPGTVVWLEDFDKPDVISGLFKRLFIYTKVIDFLIVKEEVNNEVTADLDVYGSEWRCWTSSPTEAEREATPWE